ncbi:hypothetical protein H632_c1840p1, partial [Helicosporidium sp. ATCC 50920]
DGLVQLPAAEVFGGSILSPEEFDAALAQVEGRTPGPRPAAEDDALLQSLPRELRQRSMDGVISMQSLRRLSFSAEEHRRQSSAEASASRDRRQTLAELPRALHCVSRVFGARGARALPLAELLARLGGVRAGPGGSEAVVRALARAAPEFLELKPFGSCGTPAAWIDRRADLAALSARLKRLAREAMPEE